MKLITLFFLFLAISLVSAAQTTGWKQMELKGKVKSLKSQDTHRYKAAGATVWREWEKTYGRSFLFDNTGRRTEFREFKADSLLYGIAYTYNLKEKMAELSYFGKDLKPTIKKTHVLDSKGQLLEEIEYTREGKLDRRYVYTYDDKGNMTTMTGYKSDGIMSSRSAWIYNNQGKATDYSLETPGYASSYRKYTYDEKGNMKEESWFGGNKEQTFRFVRNYDDKGNKIEEVKYKNSNTLLDMVKWRYEYDKAGNWTKRTQSTSDGTDFLIEDRTIVYY